MDDVTVPPPRRDGRRSEPDLPIRALLALALWVGLPGPAAAQPPLEKAVKASFLIKFAPFVEWPQAARAAPGNAFVLCLSGEDPFGALLDDVARGERVSGRPVIVRRLGERGGASGCHMLFAGRSADAHYAPFADVAGRPILTVTDGASGVPGSMIQFVKQAGRVRFRIDDGVARASGLVISSKLLGLAVRGDGR